MKINSVTIKVIASCFLASTLEIYDFAIFGFLGKAIHQNYLSFLDEQTSIFVTFTFFAIGFVFRPVGSIIFGYIGDIYGRKKALVTSISMMGICSFVMCILPTYSVMGILSCYIIVLVRVIQGISVGGEFTGAIVFTMEHVAEKNRALAVSILTAGGAFGVLLASMISGLLQSEFLPDYAWRGAFLVGFSLAFVGYFIRRRLVDTEEFIKLKEESKKIPLLEGIVSYKTEAVSTIFVAAANGASFYFGSVFLAKHLSNVRGDGDYSYLSLMVSFVLFASLPIFGFLSDVMKLGKKQLMYSSLLMSLIALVMVNLITYSDNVMLMNIYVIIYILCASMMISGINLYAAEIFPTKIRMSCMSFFYSIGMGVLGGTVPMISSYITENYDNPEYMLGGYIGALCLVSSISVWAVMLKQKQIKG